jgi:hypothetical protein
VANYFRKDGISSQQVYTGYIAAVVIEMEVSMRKMDTSISARNSHIEMGQEFGKTV